MSLLLGKSSQLGILLSARQGLIHMKSQAHGICYLACVDPRRLNGAWPKMMSSPAKVEKQAPPRPTKELLETDPRCEAHVRSRESGVRFAGDLRRGVVSGRNCRRLGSVPFVVVEVDFIGSILRRDQGRRFAWLSRSRTLETKGD
ncbi:hypothetical protein Droror1_Dr00017398 [Drosera rotundifolia]